MAMPAAAPPTPALPSVSALQIYQTFPDSISVHTIEDHQLEALTNVSKPFPLAVAGVAAGGVLGLVPTLVTSMRLLHTDHFGLEQVAYILLAAILLATAMYFGYAAYRGDREARRLIADIRARTRRPI